MPPPKDGAILHTFTERLTPRFAYKSFTFAITIIDILCFIVTLIVGAVEFGAAFVSENKMAGPSTQTLQFMGGKDTCKIIAGEVWRLVTPIFLHAGIIHICSNLFFTLHFGFTLETRWTTPRFIAIYFIAGIGASLLSAAASRNSISVGASGALFGLLGANMAYLVQNWSEIPGNTMEMCTLVFVVVLNLVMGLSSDQGIDNWAHGGGFLTGAFVAPLLCPLLVYNGKTMIWRVAGGVLLPAFLLTTALCVWLLPTTC